MKTKYLLGALVFPAILGACTNDVFEQQETNTLPTDPALAGRAKGNVTLVAEKSDVNAADTRVDGYYTPSGIVWAWQNREDKLGGVVVDYGVGGAIVDATQYKDYAITNYPFAPQIEVPSKSANFKTPTAVVNGAYLFYSQYKGNLTNRRSINHELPRLSKVNYGIEKGMQQIGSNEQLNGCNFFVSPIVNLAIADGSDVESPLALTSAHSILHIALTSDLESKYYNAENGLQVNKIVIKALDAKTPFKLKQTLNPATIAKMQLEVKQENPELASAFEENGAIRADNALASKALEAVIEKITGEDVDGEPTSLGFYDDEEATITSDLVYQLETPFSFKSASDVMDLLVIFPEGKYNQVSSGLETYEGKNKGVFRMTVYTSEGTYDTYIGSGDATKSLTAHRSEKINIGNKKLIIKGGETNINLFDPNQGFNVETTEDWNYAIEYIANHYRDFGNASNWKTPVLNLVAGETIVVDADHYFPGYPVKYVGDATLKLEGQDAYVIDPANMILDASNRPTLVIEDENATVSFAGDVKTDANKGKDGENYTASLKLNTAAQVVVAEGQEVNFTELTSTKGLQAGKGAIVDVNSKNAVALGGDNSFADASDIKVKGSTITLNNAAVGTEEGATLTLTGTTTTTGTLDVNPKSVMEVKGIYTNEAEANVAEDAKVSLTTATNKGDITVAVKGSIIGTTFTNDTKATLTLNGAEKDMNVNDRSIAEFSTLTNNGTIDIKDGGDRKGTYGGNLTVKARLTNNATGTISVEGQFIAKGITSGINNGVINLGENPYALLQLNDKFKSQNEGKIVLTTPTEYEMFDSYYSQRNELQAVQGVIEAELDAATYEAVMKNHDEYVTKPQETAWSVLNKIIVKGTDPLKLKNVLTTDKDFVLNEGVTLDIQTTNTKVNSLLVSGKNVTLTSAKITNVLEAEKVTVAANAELTINLALTINPETYSTAVGTNAAKDVTLDIQGKLTNNGAIDATKGNGGYTTDGDAWTKIHRVIANVASGAELINNGKLSQPSAPKYNTAVYNKINKIVEKLFVANNDYKGQFGVNVPRVETSTSEITEWVGVNAMPKSLTSNTLKSILRGGKLEMIQNYQAITCQVGKNYYALYLGEPAGKTLLKDSELEVIKEIATELSITGDSFAANPYLAHTWFYIWKNAGTVDLMNDKATAYGEIFDNTSGVKKGQFTNEK